VTIDTNQPLSSSLAARASVTLQRADDFYKNVKNDFNAFLWRGHLGTFLSLSHRLECELRRLL